MRYCAGLALPYADRVLRSRLLIVHQLARQIAVIDEDAGRLLERRSYYREVEQAQSRLQAGHLRAPTE